MRALTGTVAIVLALVATGCGDDEPGPAATTHHTALVVERRDATAAEHDRIDDDEGTGVLGCKGEGGTTWDYAPPGPNTPRGRRADDALRDAIADLNEHRSQAGAEPLASEGWVQLHDGGQTWFLLTDGDDWKALVEVGGDDTTGIWRNNEAITCP